MSLLTQKRKGRLQAAAARTLLQWLCCAAVAGSAGVALADVLPPHVMQARERLQENPEMFDRSDNFCKGKRRGDACTIGGSHVAGGGEGVCVNAINDGTGTIDLGCRRNGEAFIDRGLPDGGFVADSSFCDPEDAEMAARGARPWSCKPLTPMPVDRFCRDKAVGAACTVSLRYDGQAEQHPGVCKVVKETRGFYFRGRREMSREVVLCEATETPVQRTWTDATWWQKLRQ